MRYDCNDQQFNIHKNSECRRERYTCNAERGREFTNVAVLAEGRGAKDPNKTTANNFRPLLKYTPDGESVVKYFEEKGF